MAKCKFKMELENGEEWECPLEALPGEEYCYWHKPEDGKTPSEEQLSELKNNKIFGVYLKKAILKEMNLSGTHLNGANLQSANLDATALEGAILKRADLTSAYLKGAYLNEAHLENATLEKTHLEGAILFSAHLEGSKLWNAHLENAGLTRAYLSNADLHNTTLEGANLSEAHLENVNLSLANLKGAKLKNSHLENADLIEANLENTDFSNAKLNGANLSLVSVTSSTNFAKAELKYANLHNSYVDQSPTFRDAILFNKEMWMEINEIVGDLVKKEKVISFEKLRKKDKELADKIHKSGYVYYVTSAKAHKVELGSGYRYHVSARNKIILFDVKEGIIKEPDYYLLNQRIVKKVRQKISKFSHKQKPKNKLKKKEQEELEERIKQLLKHYGKEILYENTPENLQKLYEASYEVYNKLYYFYLQQGKFEEALQMHYRRNEVRRKLRLTKEWRSKIRAVLYDWFLMKTLTGYGIEIERPLIASLVTITLFAFLFKLTNGIVKLVDGKPVPADWIDYFYHSIITFTSLGYANIQPNLISHVPQILVGVESFLGLLLMSLFLYTVTFRISR